MLNFIFGNALRFFRLPLGYYALAVVIGLIVFGFAVNRKTTRAHAAVFGVVVTYALFVFSLTIFGRTKTETYGFRFVFLWSYSEILEGNMQLLIENILNSVMLLPLGVMLPLGFTRIKTWQTASVGFLFSLMIEVIQLISRRGLFDLDDILNNTLGCLIGLAVYKMISKIGFEVGYMIKSIKVKNTYNALTNGGRTLSTSVES